MRTLILITLLLVFQSGFSQSNTSINSKKGVLDFKVGHWRWKVKGLAAYGDMNVYNGTANSHIYYLNDSLATIDEHTISWENGIITKAITYRTYDSASDKYMVVFAQANSSYSSIIKGHWEGDKFIEIETGTDQYGEWENRMVIDNIQKDSHRAKLVRSYKSGFKVAIIEYEATRIAN